MSTVLGLDLSLTSTGMAFIGEIGRWTDKVCTKPVKGSDPVADTLRRLAHILAVIGQNTPRGGSNIATTRLVVVEGPSYGQGRQGGEHARAGLWWMVAANCRVENIPLLVVPPASLKTYTTGKGNAAKDAVLAAVIKRYADWDVPGNDIADAVGLLAIGRRMLGEPIEESLPKTHLRALDALVLP